MNIVIVGYGEMFKALIEGTLTTKHRIVGVLRHENVLMSKFKRVIQDKINPSQDLKLIREYGLFDIEADSVNSEKFRDFLRQKRIESVLVGSWSEKFSMQTINIPKRGIVNVHPSLLPKYRGPNPYLQTILHGETETGITFHLMDVNYDTGGILHQKTVKILKSDTGETLRTRCCETAKEEIPELLNNFGAKKKYMISQNENYATYYHHMKPEDTILDFQNETAEEIDRRIRAFIPWGKCVIPYNKRYFSFKTHELCKKPAKQPPATVVKKTDKSVFIVCKDKNVISFTSPELQTDIRNPLSGIYFKKFIKVNTKAL